MVLTNLGVNDTVVSQLLVLKAIFFKVRFWIRLGFKLNLT